MTNGMKWTIIGLGAVVALGLVASLVIFAVQSADSGGVPTQHAIDEAIDSCITSTVAGVVFLSTTIDSVTVSPAPTEPSPASSTSTTDPQTQTTTSSTVGVDWPHTYTVKLDAESEFFAALDLGYLGNLFLDGRWPTEAEAKLRTQFLAAGYVFVADEYTPEARDVFVRVRREHGGAFLRKLETAARELKPVAPWTVGIFTNCFTGDPVAGLNGFLEIDPAFE